ncbi:hypothetical protein Slin15195_G126740 [Septoria linicola]|uniref:Uncharacterized protein n=1 Tax=Septoria linicola TaxID=215465 RepID=A0A9Q9EQQ1_9PEZI|nr:hypothetical protein Slin15195_G126740 [Septoria linicola]
MQKSFDLVLVTIAELPEEETFPVLEKAKNFVEDELQRAKDRLANKR